MSARPAAPSTTTIPRWWWAASPSGRTRSCSVAAPSSPSTASGPCPPASWRTARPPPRGAARETLEEAGARVEIIGLYSMISLPDINQVYLVFRAKLLHLDFAPGEESLEAALFGEQDIPWDDLAFRTIHRTLMHDIHRTSSTCTYPIRRNIPSRMFKASNKDWGYFKNVNWEKRPSRYLSFQKRSALVFGITDFLESNAIGSVVGVRLPLPTSPTRGGGVCSPHAYPTSWEVCSLPTCGGGLGWGEPWLFLCKAQ
jgi:hypothetical protein